MSLDDVFVFKRRFRRRKDDKELNPFREVYYRRDYAPRVTAVVTPSGVTGGRRVSIDGSWRIRKVDKPILHGKERRIRPVPALTRRGKSNARPHLAPRGENDV